MHIQIKKIKKFFDVIEWYSCNLLCIHCMQKFNTLVIFITFILYSPKKLPSIYVAVKHNPNKRLKTIMKKKFFKNLKGKNSLSLNITIHISLVTGYRHIVTNKIIISNRLVTIFFSWCSINVSTLQKIWLVALKLSINKRLFSDWQINFYF